MHKIRILHIITHLPIGGAQDNTLSTIERLNKDRYAISLMSGPEGDWKRRALEIEGVNLIIIHEMVRDVHLFKDAIAFVKIFIEIRRGKYDIVHTHSSKPGFYGRIAAKLAGTPIIVHTIHGFPFHDFMPMIIKQFFIFIEKFLSRLSDKIITVSKLNLKQALNLELAAPKKFVNIYSGIDFSKFDQKIDVEKKRHELKICDHVKIIGVIGRLTRCKGLPYFYRAIQIVSKKREDILVLIIGDGELRYMNEEMVNRLGIASCVRFLGFRDDVPQLLKILDVYVLSSLWEGLGRALTEALYTLRPTVATSVAGVPELVKNNETGILVPPANPTALAEGILYLLDNPQLALRLAKNARALVKTKFCVNEMVHQIDQLYQELIT